MSIFIKREEKYLLLASPRTLRNAKYLEEQRCEYSFRFFPLEVTSTFHSRRREPRKRERVSVDEKCLK